MTSSGENLLNFVNHASSSVKNVLSKPGCFKRNTNHRRFLQKQLKMCVDHKTTDTSVSESKKTFSICKSKRKPTFPSRKIVKQTVKQEVNDVNNRSSPLVLPTINYDIAPCSQQTVSDYYMQALSDNCYDYNNNNNNNNDISNNNNSIATLVPSPFHRESELLDAGDFLSVMCPMDYSEPLSVSSTDSSSHYSSSDDDSQFGFLSGEDLVDSLDISELFVPDKHYVFPTISSIPDTRTILSVPDTPKEILQNLLDVSNDVTYTPSFDFQDECVFPDLCPPSPVSCYGMSSLETVFQRYSL